MKSFLAHGNCAYSRNTISFILFLKTRTDSFFILGKCIEHISEIAQFDNRSFLGPSKGHTTSENKNRVELNKKNVSAYSGEK